jgi:hypothetical protein
VASGLKAIGAAQPLFPHVRFLLARRRRDH